MDRFKSILVKNNIINRRVIMSLKKRFMFSFFLLVPFGHVNAVEIHEIIAPLSEITRHTKISYSVKKEGMFEAPELTPKQNSCFTALEGTLEGYGAKDYKVTSILQKPAQEHLYDTYFTHFVPDAEADVAEQPNVLPSKKGLIILWTLNPPLPEIEKGLEVYREAYEQACAKIPLRRAASLMSLKMLIEEIRDTGKNDIYYSEDFSPEMQKFVESMGVQVLKPNTGFTVHETNGEFCTIHNLQKSLL
jgi:hypothetical protein